MTRVDSSRSVPSSLPRLLRGRTLKTASGMTQDTISCRPGVRARRAAQTLGAGLAMGLTLLVSTVSHAGIGDDPTLVLGVSRDGRVDQQITKAVTDRMLHNGENVLTNNRLLSSDRQCLSGECFDNIASRERAHLLFTSQLQQNAPGSYYITAVLYDAVKHIPFQEGSPCECSSEELALKVSDLADKLLKRYRERPLVPSVSEPSAPNPPSAGVVGSGPESIPSTQPKKDTSTGIVLSHERKVAAGVLGGLAAITLATSIALTVINGRHTGDLCMYDAQPDRPAEMRCNLNTTAFYGTGYALTGGLLIGLGFTLFWPPNNPGPEQDDKSGKRK